MTILLIILVLLLILAGVALLVVFVRHRSFGTLSGTYIYADSQEIPGEVLYSNSLQLKGKPDYIIKRGSMYIPVEVKTGRTPSRPYPNHIMQLIAYCVLVEEQYGSRPKLGVIKYPEKEFEIGYTIDRKKALLELLEEMKVLKKNGYEPGCSHPEHN